VVGSFGHGGSSTRDPEARQRAETSGTFSRSRTGYLSLKGEFVLVGASELGS
jgi:hypothetical protein